MLYCCCVCVRVCVCVCVCVVVVLWQSRADTALFHFIPHRPSSFNGTPRNDNPPNDQITPTPPTPTHIYTSDIPTTTRDTDPALSSNHDRSHERRDVLACCPGGEGLVQRFRRPDGALLGHTNTGMPLHDAAGALFSFFLTSVLLSGRVAGRMGGSGKPRHGRWRGQRGWWGWGWQYCERWCRTEWCSGRGTTHPTHHPGGGGAFDRITRPPSLHRHIQR